MCVCVLWIFLIWSQEACWLIFVFSYNNNQIFCMLLFCVVYICFSSDLGVTHTAWTVSKKNTTGYSWCKCSYSIYTVIIWQKSKSRVYVKIFNVGKIFDLGEKFQNACLLFCSDYYASFGACFKDCNKLFVCSFACFFDVWFFWWMNASGFKSSFFFCFVQMSLCHTV